ncbi:protein yqgE [Vibrio ishigakensis]|uniref:Protein yqgE n=1 Tax=Vibrio ishigakensis TaxID=1481914 RepID=A0A0B8NVU1_9VIBR|nr:protein yqgE [Vibrio ishigakensis]
MNLTNHFLVAMPSMKDPFFKRSVIYVCEHNENGAMGIMINAPIDITVGGMLKQVEVEPELPQDQDSLNQPVHNGGPVAENRGFILHQPKDKYQSSIDMTEALSMTTSKDILEVLGTADEPDRYLVALGYSAGKRDSLKTNLQRTLGSPWKPTLRLSLPLQCKSVGTVQ